MTVYFRLLAGFTSFISKRCLSHFCSIGPSGTFDFSSMLLCPVAVTARIMPRYTAIGMTVNPAHTSTASASASWRRSGRGDGGAQAQAAPAAPDRRDRGAGPTAAIASS